MVESKSGSVAVVGGGCFWCLEAIFQRLQGVHAVISGYAGGPLAHPSYEQVCSGQTGHAEVVRIEFNPAVLSFASLLEVFFHLHDPTTLNRQGAEVGTQYRSVIFCQDEAQATTAREVIAVVNGQGVYPLPIVTQVTAAPPPPFFPSEAYHHNYYNTHTHHPYCQAVIDPKIHKLVHLFPRDLV